MSANSFKYRMIDDKPGTAVITLGKNVLGGNEALEFSSKLEDLCKSDVSLVAVDLSKVELMNSSGLGMLVNGLSAMKKHDKSLVLVAVPQKVDTLLKMTHLNEVFRVLGDISEI